ncbi:hypothetical protein O9K51_01913 [Purpureocillium lavendulum]|uniref:Uncharacterized protein n=1 Tax=Purpureocillium lavendulum TaxID=1247861 RepID=A0AB34G7Y8_9HYPO|nr:hypothetical protein O9K51_01913 [Purpureocillium lavendulum]
MPRMLFRRQPTIHSIPEDVLEAEVASAALDLFAAAPDHPRPRLDGIFWPIGVKLIAIAGGQGELRQIIKESVGLDIHLYPLPEWQWPEHVGIGIPVQDACKFNSIKLALDNHGIHTVFSEGSLVVEQARKSMRY